MCIRVYVYVYVQLISVYAKVYECQFIQKKVSFKKLCTDK